MNLYEKYRPKSIQDFIGQEKIVKSIKQVFARDGFGSGGGEAFYLTGPTGTGKTTLAQIMSRLVGVDPGASWNYSEIDGDKCSVDKVRGLDHRAENAGLFKDTWQVFIVNEAHELQSRAVSAWLTLLERLPANWLVIFTTNQPASEDLFGNLTEALLSRCKVFQFTNQGLSQPMAAALRKIAVDEKLDGKPVEAYVKLIQKKHNNMRAALQAIGSFEMVD